MNLYRFGRGLIRIFYKTFYRYRVLGQENIPQGAAIIAANHASFFDPTIIGVSFPEEIHYLARDTLFKPKPFGALLRAVNVHPVKRGGGDIAVFKEICKLLGEGKKVVLFPEGTRTETGEMGEIKAGVAFLMARMHCPVIPVYIEGSYAVWSRHSRFPKLSGELVCVIGKPIEYQEFAHLDKKSFERAFAERLKTALLTLKNKPLIDQ